MPGIDERLARTLEATDLVLGFHVLNQAAFERIRGRDLWSLVADLWDLQSDMEHEVLGLLPSLPTTEIRSHVDALAALALRYGRRLQTEEQQADLADVDFEQLDGPMVALQRAQEGSPSPTPRPPTDAGGARHGRERVQLLHRELGRRLAGLDEATPPETLERLQCVRETIGFHVRHQHAFEQTGSRLADLIGDLGRLQAGMELELAALPSTPTVRALEGFAAAMSSLALDYGTRLAAESGGRGVSDVDFSVLDRLVSRLRVAETPDPSRRGPTPIAPPVMTDAASMYLGFHAALVAQDERWPTDLAQMEAAALWGAFALVASRRRQTLATLVTRVVLRLRGGGTTRQGPAVLLRAFAIPGTTDPLPLTSIERLASHPLLVAAVAVRDDVERGEPIHLRHLVAAAIVAAPGPLGADTRQRDMDALRDEFLGQIEHDAPADVAQRWRAHFEHRAAIGHVVADRPARALAGLGVDMVNETTRLSDELRVVDDVVTLCDVLAARDATPPISVGLFGRWGSGKSYFMALMRRRIDDLQVAARRAREMEQDTTYCSEIVQVTFNAWHYMDADDLWATMAVHLFGAIAQVDPDDRSARPRADVLRDLHEREKRMETIDRRITRALGDDRLDGVAERMGLQSHRAGVLSLLEEIGTTIGLLSAIRLVLTAPGRTHVRRLLTLAIGTCLLALALAGGLIVSRKVSTDWLVGWIPLLAVVTATLGRWTASMKRGLVEINRIAHDFGLQPADITADRVRNDHRILELREELEAIDRLTGTHQWLRERAHSSDYTSHFGVISVLRGDLEALVEKQRRDSPDRRIILYIDDLDRCPPARVVEVLQAVHLLLALPLFVAVVGVDPRWLLRSLERHYLQIQAMPCRDSVEGAQMLGETTPHDYLEKIFQIPFALAPMDSDGFGRLISSVAGPPMTEATTPRADASRTGARPVAARDAVGDRPSSPAGSARPDAAPPQGPLPEPSRQTGDPSRLAGDPPAPPADPPDDDTTERVSTAPQEIAPISPNPPQLQITALEVAALSRMAPLIKTPRAAKRLVNLYRLIRAGLPADDIRPFVDEAQFRSLAIVLALQVGYPRSSRAMLDQLSQGAGTMRVSAWLAGHAGRSVGAVEETAAGIADRTESAAMRSALRAVCVDDGGRRVDDFDCSLAELQRWIPALCRYSFEGALGRAT